MTGIIMKKTEERRPEMYRTMRSLIALLLICVAGAYAQEGGREVMGHPPPIEPPNLSVIPTANVVGSLDIDLSGAGVFLGEESTVFRGAALLGIGNIAEVGISTAEMISSLKKANKHAGGVPAGGIKLAFPVWRYWQGVAASFRRSGTYEENVLVPASDRVATYKEKVAEFSVVTSVANFATPGEGASKGGGWKGAKVKAHLGLDYVNATLTASEIDVDEKGSFIRPFAGLEMWRGGAQIPQSRIVAEFGWAAHFDRDKDGNEEIDDVWIVVGGVRFFWHRYGTVDIGVRYQSNYDELVESTIQIQFRMGWPTHLIRDRIIGL